MNEAALVRVGTAFTAAQATIDELRAEVERLTKENVALKDGQQIDARNYLECDAERERLTRQLQEMTDDRDSWLQQADDRAADALRFAKESEALKAKQIDVEAVMRLAEEYADWCASDSRDGSCESLETCAAREALRASLLGDGGTL